MNTHDLGNLVEVILDNKVVDPNVRLGWIRILCEDYFTINKLNDKIEQIQAYCRLLQEGDPQNEQADKILDEMDRITERRN